MAVALIPSEVCEELFALRLGFLSFDALMEIAEPAYSAVGQLWFLVRLPDHRWLASPVTDIDDTHRFPTVGAARDFVVSNID